MPKSAHLLMAPHDLQGCQSLGCPSWWFSQKWSINVYQKTHTGTSSSYENWYTTVAYQYISMCIISISWYRNGPPPNTWIVLMSNVPPCDMDSTIRIWILSNSPYAQNQLGPSPAMPAGLGCRHHWLQCSRHSWCKVSVGTSPWPVAKLSQRLL